MLFLEINFNYTVFQKDNNGTADSKQTDGQLSVRKTKL